MKLQIMDHTGHTTIEFSKVDNTEAMQKFRELMDGKYTAAVIRDGKKTLIQNRKADLPLDADEVIMMPQLQGG